MSDNIRNPYGMPRRRKPMSAEAIKIQHEYEIQYKQKALIASQAETEKLKYSTEQMKIDNEELKGVILLNEKKEQDAFYSLQALSNEELYKIVELKNSTPQIIAAANQEIIVRSKVHAAKIMFKREFRRIKMKERIEGTKD